MIAAVIRLIRLPNLLMIALTQYLVRYCLFVEFTEFGNTLMKGHIVFTLSNTDFFLLVLSTIFITAAGYIINDINDTVTDHINRPERQIINKIIHPKKAYTAYYTLNIAGILLGFYCAYKTGSVNLTLIHLATAGLLYFYSTTYKGIYLLGNIVVALLSGLVPLLVAIFEPKVYHPFHGIFAYVTGYGVFAFLLTLIREILKDAEDAEGDKAAGYKTLAVVSGSGIAKISAVLLSILVICLLGWIEYLYMTEDYFSTGYFIAAVQLPLAALCIMTIIARKPRQYRISGHLAKLIMLTGILSMIVFYYSL